MNSKSVAKAILEAVDDKERDDAEKHDELVPEVEPEKEPDIDNVVPDSQEFAPDANMTIKDKDDDDLSPYDNEDRGDDGMPSEPGGIDLERVNAKAAEIGMHPVDDIDLYTLYDGAKVEFEHTKDFDIAAAIAAHHIAEDPRYYEFLERMEDEMRKDRSREPGVGSDEANREVGAGVPKKEDGLEPEVEDPDDDLEDVA